MPKFKQTNAEKKGFVSKSFAHRLICIYEDRGIEWLDNLENLLEYCAERWSLTLGSPFPRLSYNYVTPAKKEDGREIVLKVGVVNSELISEMETLSYFEGGNAVELLEFDKKKGILLLEKLSPGKMLIDLSEEEATINVAKMMLSLAKPIADDHKLEIPMLKRWFRGLKRVKEHYGPDGPLPKDLVATTEGLYNELEASTVQKIVLHGDLHHYNVLSSTRKPWVCIDPKGYIGEAESEVGAFLRNPLPLLFREIELAPLIEPRLEILHDILGYDKKRMLAWALVESVIAACWCIEDNIAGWGIYMKCARLFEKYLKQY